MGSKIGWIRAGLYVALLIFSFILFALSCARINYTLHLSRTDPLNRGISFYDPVIPELIFTTLVTMAWSGLMLVLFFSDALKIPFLKRHGEELIGIIVLWFFWVGGAAAASALWGDLSFCQQFQTCQVLSALEAFAWFGWLTLTALIVLSLVVFVQSQRKGGKGLEEPLPTRRDDWPGLEARKDSV
ncbi:hypothetical protein BT96DRAFT_713522 [Gymnopus androsaceus JB14]|uniref:MARVEL domain-containing protein n=1 Tax=Gymnopus androsaceus JB14 TaxID=1447944 RepID=A0A6A4HQ03_9AGAR|nr:hypothetical protein BT96DRAFT_713522 [Gymnopus androsaceus JB14]